MHSKIEESAKALAQANQLASDVIMELIGHDISNTVEGVEMEPVMLAPLVAAKIKSNLSRSVGVSK